MSTAAERVVRLGGTAARMLFDERAIAERVAALGRDITAYYPDGDLLLLGLLKGSFVFLADLMRQIERPLQIDFLVAASYGSGATSSGEVKLHYDPQSLLKGKHVLLVEDIVDSGRTLNQLVRLLRVRDPRSLEMCALLHKHLAPALDLEPRFVGFDAPSEFLVGYGLDFAENLRHLPFVASLGADPRGDSSARSGYT